LRSDHLYGEEHGKPANGNLNDIPSGSPAHDVIVDETSELETLLDREEMPSEHPYINLALELHQSSLGASTKIGFIFLMNGMEVLLGPGDMEPRYSTSRNAAVLLAIPEDPSEDIFKRMMGLFKKRTCSSLDSQTPRNPGR